LQALRAGRNAQLLPARQAEEVDAAAERASGRDVGGAGAHGRPGRDGERVDRHDEVDLRDHVDIARDLEAHGLARREIVVARVDVKFLANVRLGLRRRRRQEDAVLRVERPRPLDWKVSAFV
jgi:hypothetical protein